MDAKVLATRLSRLGESTNYVVVVPKYCGYLHIHYWIAFFGSFPQYVVAPNRHPPA